jgi:hypothetical protein
MMTEIADAERAAEAAPKTPASELTAEERVALEQEYRTACKAIVAQSNVLRRIMACGQAQTAWERLYPWTVKGPGLTPPKKPEGATEHRTYVTAVAEETRRSPTTVRLDCEIARGLRDRHVVAMIEKTPLREATTILRDLSRKDVETQLGLVGHYSAAIKADPTAKTEAEARKVLVAAMRPPENDGEGKQDESEDGLLFEEAFTVHEGRYVQFDFEGRRYRLSLKKVGKDFARTRVEILQVPATLAAPEAEAEQAAE